MALFKKMNDHDFIKSEALSDEDSKRISEIIAYYKATGRKKLLKKQSKSSHGKKKQAA